MNFYDLSAKLRAIDESSVAECGDMMPSMIAHAPQQSNSVTMNVSMNGSGAGGIKDLMDILRNIEQAAEHDHDHEEPMIAQPHDMDGDVDVILGTADEDMLANPDAKLGAGAGDESYGNSAPGGSDAHQFGIDSVTRHGDDMHSKGSVKRLRVNGGENPLQEGLVERLSAMYQEIKEAGDKKTMSRAAKGVMKYGKEGMRKLADAGKKGKDLEPIRAKYNKYDESLEEGMGDPVVNINHDDPQRPTIDVPVNMLYGQGADTIKRAGLPMPREGQKIPLVADDQSVRSNLKGYDVKDNPNIRKMAAMGSTMVPPLMFPFTIEPNITGEVAWPDGIALVQPKDFGQLMHPPK